MRAMIYGSYADMFEVPSIHIGIVHCVKHPLFPKTNMSQGFTTYKKVFLIHIVILNFNQRTYIIHHLGPLRAIWHQGQWGCLHVSHSEIECLLPKLNSSFLNEVMVGMGLETLLFNGLKKKSHHVEMRIFLVTIECLSHMSKYKRDESYTYWN